MPKSKTVTQRYVGSRQAQFADRLSKLMDGEFKDLTMLECVGVFEALKHGCLSRMFVAAAHAMSAKAQAAKKGGK